MQYVISITACTKNQEFLETLCILPILLLLLWLWLSFILTFVIAIFQAAIIRISSSYYTYAISQDCFSVAADYL